MIIDLDNKLMSWDRQVDYPQPHTQYFYNTLQMMSKVMINPLTKLDRCNDLVNEEDDMLLTLKRYFSNNLQVKQAFIN